MDLQYKYIVRNGDGSVARWMAGDNFSLQTAPDDAELPSTLRVSDSWDASVHAIEVCHAEALQDALALRWLCFSVIVAQADTMGIADAELHAEHMQPV